MLRAAILTLAALASFASAVSIRSFDDGSEQFGSMVLFAAADDGVDPQIKTSGHKVFYIAPGKGSCGIDYHDHSMVACLSAHWMGKDKSKNQMNSCQRYVKVINPDNGITVQVQALDSCGGPGTGFHDNDIYLSKKPFEILSGGKSKGNLVAGNLGVNVKWSFVQESCEGCWTGQIARDAHGKRDTCTGNDALGRPRCGLKRGLDRITSSKELLNVCKTDFKCPA